MMTVRDLNIVLRQADDSLYFSVKDKETKRVFGQTFSKSMLQSMQLLQPIPQIIKMIESAQNEDITQLSINIGYINTEKINKVAASNVKSTYTKGDCLCFIIKQDLAWNPNEFIFKLLEQKRDEVEILHDVIEDLKQTTQTQNEKIEQLTEAVAALTTRLDEMEQKQDSTSMHFGKWATTLAAGGNIKWNVVKQEPTLEGMILRMEENNQKLVFGIAGLYRITYRWTSREDNKSSYRGGYLYLNGSKIAQSVSYNSNANGEMTEMINIQVGDQINSWCGAKKGTSDTDCGLTIQRLGICV